MKDFKITLNKRQGHFLSRLLPKGYSFQQYKVRKNINDYPYKEYDKKYKKTESIILSKKESIMLDSLEISEKSFRQKSQVPSIIREQLAPLQMDLLWLVRKLRKHQSSYPFRFPVDPKALQIPDYFDVVLQPIDLKTIEQQIRSDEYHYVSEFERDIYKMIMNSYKFNQKLTSTYNKTIQFESFFVSTMKEWEKTKYEQQAFARDEKNFVKDEILDENIPINVQHQEIEKKLEDFNLWNLKENPLVSLAQNIVSTQSNTSSQKKQPKLLKVLTEMAQERSIISKKKLPKMQQVSNQITRTESKQTEQLPNTVKKEEPEISSEQQSIPLQAENLVYSQPMQSEQPQIKNQQQQQQIIDEMGEFLQNQTVRDQNCSQGYNQFTSGNKIRNIEVQKQISGLLKKLNEFPLTKQKKNKLFSKFTNLDQNMTQSDKKKLFDKISKLDENDIEYVVQILTRGKQDLLKNEEFQIDLDKADSKVLRQIQNFIAIRDNSLVVPIENGTLPIGRPQSLDIIKVPKKVKKQEKKILKKKISRKNSNDDSFSINPPQIKKKKSQKPTKRHPRIQQSLNGEANSINDEKSQSSYHPEPVHHIRVSSSQHLNKNTQAEKGGQSQKQKLCYEEKKKYESRQETSSKLEGNQIFINSNVQSSHQTAYHYESREIYDIDQFLVSSKNLNDPESSPQHGLFTSGRKKRKSLDPLDLIYDHNFQFGQSGVKDYPEEEIREFSMDEPRKQHNDDDQFF